MKLVSNKLTALGVAVALAGCDMTAGETLLEAV